MNQPASPLAPLLSPAALALALLLVTTPALHADEAPATQPAVKPAPAAPGPVASDFRLDYQRIFIGCETDLVSGTTRVIGPSTLECVLTAPAGVTRGTVTPRVKSILDDQGKELTWPPIDSVSTSSFSSANPLGQPIATPVRVTLPVVPAPPRTLGQIKGELLITAPITGKPFDIPLDVPGTTAPINDKQSIKIQALSRDQDKKRLVVGVAFIGLEKGIYDQAKAPYLLRAVLLDKDGKELPSALRGNMVPGMNEVVYTFETPDADSKVALRFVLVTELREFVVPLDLKLKRAPKK